MQVVFKVIAAPPSQQRAASTQTADLAFSKHSVPLQKSAALDAIKAVYTGTASSSCSAAADALAADGVSGVADGQPSSPVTPTTAALARGTAADSDSLTASDSSDSDETAVTTPRDSLTALLADDDCAGRQQDEVAALQLQVAGLTAGREKDQKQLADQAVDLQELKFRSRLPRYTFVSPVPLSNCFVLLQQLLLAVGS